MRQQEITTHHYLLRIERGEEIIQTVTTWCKANTVTLAELRGIGAAQNVVLSSYNLETKQYEQKAYPESVEIASFTGNISLVDNEPFCHIHVVIGIDTLEAKAGHLHSATVSGTMEIFVTTYQTTVRRLPDSETGLKLLDLSETILHE